MFASKEEVEGWWRNDDLCLKLSISHLTPKSNIAKENGNLRASPTAPMVYCPNWEINTIAELTSVWVLFSIIDMADDLLDLLNGAVPRQQSVVIPILRLPTTMQAPSTTPQHSFLTISGTSLTS
jgi:hypothetical protein